MEKISAKNWWKNLSEEDVIIVSGLAFGIDSIAHKASVKYMAEDHWRFSPWA